jgi:hypothetical protein
LFDLDLCSLVQFIARGHDYAHQDNFHPTHTITRVLEHPYFEMLHSRGGNRDPHSKFPKAYYTYNDHALICEPAIRQKCHKNFLFSDENERLCLFKTFILIYIINSRIWLSEMQLINT